MKFYTYGDKQNDVIIMLAGSFCPAKALEYLYNRLMGEYYIIVPEYNGNYPDSVFTTRKEEAKRIVDYLKKENISNVKMVYGQSMGAEIAIELIHQMNNAKIAVDKSFFDGAPCIKLSKPYKMFMYFKFKTMLNMMKNKSVDDIINWKFLNAFTNGETETLRPLLNSLKTVAPYLTKESVKNQVECCYTFDFPTMSEQMQKNMFFLYAKGEKAYKACFNLVNNAYPNAHYKALDNGGHMTYSVSNTEEYIVMLKNICMDKNVF